MEKVCLKKLQRVLYYLVKVQEGQIYLVEVLKGGWICLLIPEISGIRIEIGGFFW